MTEKSGFVKNPLSIIAIFAGLSEVSGTGVLPFISDGNQHIFIWFLMIFPTVLVLSFFGILVYDHHVLYAPSDFKNESNYFRGMRTASPQEVAEKFQAEIRETVSADKDSSSAEQEVRASAPNDSAANSEGLAFDEARDAPAAKRPHLGERLRRAENIILARLSAGNADVVKEAAFDVQEGGPIIFDGAVKGVNSLKLIEVTYVPNARSNFASRLRHILDRYNRLRSTMPETARSGLSITIFMVVDKESDIAEMNNRLEKYNRDHLLPNVDFIALSFQTLEQGSFF